MSFFPLDKITDKATEIYERAKEEIANIDPSTVPVGFLEQLELQLQRFNPAKSSPTCEVVIVPGFWSGPSACSQPKHSLPPLIELQTRRSLASATSRLWPSSTPRSLVVPL